MSHLFTLCRGALIQKRSKPCCTTGRSFPSTLSLVCGPVDDPSQSLPSSHNACPPVVVVQITPPGIPDFTALPSVVSHNPIIDRQYHGTDSQGSTYVWLPRDVADYGLMHPLTCERKRYTADFPRAIIGLRDDA